MLLRPILLVLVLAASGCDAGLNSDLVGTRWVLAEVTPTPADTAALASTSILFTSETAVEIASCNACSGPIGRRSNELDFRGLACTKQVCPDRLDLGPRLAASERVVFSLSDDGLLLVADEGEALRTFTFVAEE